MSKASEEAARKELERLKGLRKGVGRRVLALDPGTAATGIAVMVDGDPVFLNVVRATGGSAEDRLPDMCQRVATAVTQLMAQHRPDTFVVEWQSIRPSDPRPNDILHLSIVLGAALSVPREPFCRLKLPLPVQWKGTINKDTFTKRVLGQWPQALDFLHGCPAHLRHNALDALAMAYWGIAQRLPWQA